MTSSRDSRLTNVLGSFALALADRIHDATQEASGTTGAAPAALVALQQFLSGRSTEDLAQATGLTHSGAVRLVDRLAGARLVERRPGRDARTSSIVLTASGRALSRKITKARATAINDALEGLDNDERETLLELVDSLISKITAQRLLSRKEGDVPSGWLCRMCDFAACGRSHSQCPAANTARDLTCEPGSAPVPIGRPTPRGATGRQSSPS